jgi:2-dehydro-3-deoxy-D-arabinonate dehydratase
MYLTQHQTGQDARWALDGYFLPPQLNLGLLLGLPKVVMLQLLQTLPTEELAIGELLAPLDPEHEVWACGSNYLVNAEAHYNQTAVSDWYTKVDSAHRPELFFKAIGWRVSGHNIPIRVRQDSTWTVPEPELALVINRHHEIVGFCSANDVSSRSIETENPLYLPQAKFITVHVR